MSAGAPKTWSLTHCFALTALSIALASGRPSLEVERHPHRLFADFASFWPLYVQQHGKPLTKILHVIGTCVTLLAVVPRKGFSTFVRMSCGLASGVCLSLCAEPLTARFSTGLPEAVLMILFVVAASKPFTGLTSSTIVKSLLPAYALPWVAHAFVEHNKPATFLHPTFSLLGDFRLIWSLAVGNLTLDATDA